MAKTKTREEKIQALRLAYVAQANKAHDSQNKRITAALAEINKKYGAETLTTVIGGKAQPVKGIKTEWQGLDDLLTGETDAKNKTIKGTGVGLPRGRIIEVFGPESSGKTTLVLHFIKAVQEAGGVAAYIDAEHALDLKYASNLGVDLSTLIISQPDSAEQALDVAADLCRKGIDFIAIDSVSALSPADEDEASVGKSQVALQARLMSKGLRKITQHVSAGGSVLLFVNQVRMKIGVMFGNPETTSGGNALKFYASTRLDVRKVKTLKKGDKNVGIRSRIKTVKNKAAPPFREIHADIFPNQGIVTVYDDPEFGGDE